MRLGRPEAAVPVTCLAEWDATHVLLWLVLTASADLRLNPGSRSQFGTASHKSLATLKTNLAIHVDPLYCPHWAVNTADENFQVTTWPLVWSLSFEREGLSAFAHHCIPTQGIGTAPWCLGEHPFCLQDTFGQLHPRLRWSYDT